MRATSYIISTSSLGSPLLKSAECLETIRGKYHMLTLTIFPLHLTMTDVLPGSPLGSGICPTLQQLQSPPFQSWEGGWEGKEKKQEEIKVLQRTNGIKGGRPILNGGRERLKLEKPVSTTTWRRASPQSSAWRHDSTWNKTRSQSPSSSILPGLQLVTAWQEPQAERQEGPSEYQATWILGLSQHNCFDVIAVYQSNRRAFL